MNIVQKAIYKLFSLTRVGSSWNWWGRILEPFTGAWQKNITLDTGDKLLSFSAVYACVTGIATDVAKLRIKLDKDENGIWVETTSGSPWLPVLRKPNHYQNRIKFVEQWIVSKLLSGNLYALKERDSRGIVTALYILDPHRVTPLVSESGDVYYQLQKDLLSLQPEDMVVVPASEIIHDMMVCLWHPLVGVSPLYACALSATMGNRIQNSSTIFFDNRALPGGTLSSDHTITDVTANRLREDWQKNFGGDNRGRVAVLGDGLKFEAMQMTAEASQLAEQLKWTVEDVARAFHYPLYKLGGPLPPYAGNVDAVITSYYTDCLQILIESLELSLDEGLELPRNMGTEMDLDNLMRMDTAALYETNNKAVGGGWLAPDEARFRANYKPVAGGKLPYLQQQNYSLEALAKRDADNPFEKPKPAPVAPPPDPEPTPEPTPSKEAMEYACRKKLLEFKKRKDQAA
ncbi:phage portal protein [bacterium]|nr:MAG: phage portal protein [bacterium]